MHCHDCGSLTLCDGKTTALHTSYVSQQTRVKSGIPPDHVITHLDSDWSQFESVRESSAECCTKWTKLCMKMSIWNRFTAVKEPIVYRNGTMVRGIVYLGRLGTLLYS